jgi:hypothetical protein
MEHAPYVERLVSEAISATREDGFHTLVLTRDENEAQEMLACADKQLGKARYCGRQLLVNGAHLYVISTGTLFGETGMLWFIECDAGDPDMLDECLNPHNKSFEYVWWPTRDMDYSRVLFSDWLRERARSVWRPQAVRGDLFVKAVLSPLPPPPDPSTIATAWQMIMTPE